MAYTLTFIKKLMYTMNASIKTSPPHPWCAKRQYPSKRKDADLQYCFFRLYKDLTARVSVLEEIFRLLPTIQVDKAAFTKAVISYILAFKHYVGARHFQFLKIIEKWVCPIKDCNRNY